MKRTTKWVVGSTLLGLAIYAISPGSFSSFNTPGFWSFRRDLVSLSGVIAMVLMTLVVLISVRGGWIERYMGGLDKGYVVHKWAGVWATITAFLHWFAEKVPKWTFSWGIYPERVRGAGPSAGPPPQWQTSLWQTGNSLVEYTIYVIVALVIIALVHKIPYRHFRFTHKLFPALYLLVAFHSVTILYKLGWMGHISGHAVVALGIVGTVAALIGLFQMIGATRKVGAVVTGFDRYDNGVVDVRLETVGDRRMVTTPGQFGYLAFAHGGEPHPFTFTSSGDDPTKMRFGIKALGHYTSRLGDSIAVGQRVQVEGPYGQFHFDHTARRQVWIAGGIGITPFLARLENLDNTGGTKVPVDFWYCVADAENGAFPRGLGDLCQRTGVRLHIMLADKGEFLTADVINDTVGSLEGVNILFCGPRGFAQCLLEGLKSYSFNERDFHYDNFGMR